MQLQPGTYLQGDKYRIIHTLGNGGFGITYLAEHAMTERKVCIKEFFPKGYYTRAQNSTFARITSEEFAENMMRFMTKFVKEAKTIASLDHSNIIQIYDSFEENGTAYYVMEYVDGETLSAVVKRHGALPEEDAVKYICQVADALAHIHSRQIMHLDVKPGNMMLRSRDDRAILIDFGLSKHYDEKSGEATSTTPVGVSHGFAPMEQYQQGGVKDFSPETDIYSLGASLYYLVTGNVPPQVAKIVDEGLPEFPAHLSPSVRNAIECSMEIQRKHRPHSIEEFLSLLGVDYQIIAPNPPTESVLVNEETVISVQKVDVAEADDTTSLDIPQVESEQEKDVSAQPKKEWTPKYAIADKKNRRQNETIKRLLLLLLVVGVIGFITLVGSAGEDDNEMSAKEESLACVHEGHAYVDLGLDVKWATCNVGAETPEDYGGYYAWGETNTKGIYDKRNSETYGKNISNIDSIGGDVAHVQWGGNWRMPTKEEFDDLINNCQWKWTGKGYNVTGPNGNSIFLPAAGCRDIGSSVDEDIRGHYWSSTPDLDKHGNSFYLYFYNGDKSTIRNSRYYGHSIRPVLD